MPSIFEFFFIGFFLNSSIQESTMPRLITIPDSLSTGPLRPIEIETGSEIEPALTLFFKLNCMGT